MKHDDGTSFLLPEALYTLPGFKRATGLGNETLRLARRGGVYIQTMQVGRRKYVRGADGIGFIEELAAKRSSARAGDLSAC